MNAQLKQLAAEREQRKNGAGSKRPRPADDITNHSPDGHEIVGASTSTSGGSSSSEASKTRGGTGSSGEGRGDDAPARVVGHQEHVIDLCAGSDDELGGRGHGHGFDDDADSVALARQLQAEEERAALVQQQEQQQHHHRYAMAADTGAASSTSHFTASVSSSSGSSAPPSSKKKRRRTGTGGIPSIDSKGKAVETLSNSELARLADEVGFSRPDAELAKSGRSACKACQVKITKVS